MSSCYHSIMNEILSLQSCIFSGADQFESIESEVFQVTTERVQFDGENMCKRKKKEKGGNIKKRRLEEKAIKRQCPGSQQHSEASHMHANAAQSLENQNPAEEADNQHEDTDSNNNYCLASQQASFRSTNSGVDAPKSSLKRDGSLSRHSKWSKFLAPSSEDETTSPNNHIFSAAGSVPLVEFPPNFPDINSNDFVAHALTETCQENRLSPQQMGYKQHVSTLSRNSAKELCGSSTQTKSTKLASVFSIDDDLEENW